LHFDEPAVDDIQVRRRAHSDGEIDYCCLAEEHDCGDELSGVSTSEGTEIESVCSWSTDDEESAFEVASDGFCKLLSSPEVSVVWTPVFAPVWTCVAAPRSVPCAVGFVDAIQQPLMTSRSDATNAMESSGRYDRFAEQFTTIIIRGIPSDLKRESLTRALDADGFSGKYDFVYVPASFTNYQNIGYALVNMVDEDAAKIVMDHFRHAPLKGAGHCEWSFSNGGQGLAAQIERYRDSSVMHCSVPPQFKPAMYHRGLIVPFPEPTKKLRMPRIRHSKNV